MLVQRCGTAMLLLAAWTSSGSLSATSQELIRVSGILHEPKPTESQGIADARVEVVGGELAGQVLTTDREGRFALPPVRSTAFTLSFTKRGYVDTRVEVDRALSGAPSGAVSGGTLDVVAMPEERDITLIRSGRDDCVDLPKPPDGVPGLREYARIPVHHDGTIVVTAAQLPFSRNSGYLYRLTPSGWTKNEFDYILLRTPVPVQGGFLYLITFGEDEDRCGAWSIDATHPS